MWNEEQTSNEYIRKGFIETTTIIISTSLILTLVTNGLSIHEFEIRWSVFVFLNVCLWGTD